MQDNNLFLRFKGRQPGRGAGSVQGGVLHEEKCLLVRRFMLEGQDGLTAQGLAVPLAGPAAVQAFGANAAIVPFRMDHIAFRILTARTAAAHKQIPPSSAWFL